MNVMDVYVNNAATSYPKPPEVIAAVTEAIGAPPADPLRGPAEVDLLGVARELTCRLFQVPSPRQVILTTSGTMALNVAIQGAVTPGARVAVSTWEHNSSSRPLAHLASRSGVAVQFFDPSVSEENCECELGTLLERGVSVVVMSLASNVTGDVFPCERVARLVARYGATLILDASQAAGCIEIRYRDLPGRVYLAMSGHKGLYGPTGTGLLVVPDAHGEPVIYGGTGVHGNLELQPMELPYRYEAGTHNLVGIAGLVAGLRYVLSQQPRTLGNARAECTDWMRTALTRLEHVRLLPLRCKIGQIGIVSFVVPGWDPTDFCSALFDVFRVTARGGLQCSPNAHRQLGTLPAGAVRLSFGAHHGRAQLEYVFEAIRQLAIRGQS